MPELFKIDIIATFTFPKNDHGDILGFTETYEDVRGTKDLWDRIDDTLEKGVVPLKQYNSVSLMVCPQPNEVNMATTDPNFNPSGNAAVTDIKNAVVELEKYILHNVAPGRRRSLALTKLEDFSMWAVKAAVVGDE